MRGNTEHASTRSFIDRNIIFDDDLSEPELEAEEDKPGEHFAKAPPLSRFTWWNWPFYGWAQLTWEWITPLLIRGCRRLPLKEADLYELPPKGTASHLSAQFQRQYSKGRKSVLASLNRLFGLKLWLMAGSFRLISALCSVTTPFVLMTVLRNMQSTSPLPVVISWLMALFLLRVVHSVLHRHYHHLVAQLGMRARSVLMNAIYQKSLSLSNKARRRNPDHKIVDMFKADCAAVQQAFTILNHSWARILEATLSSVFLWFLLGPIALIALGITVALAALQLVAVWQIKVLVSSAQRHANQRLGLIQEVYNNIRLVKSMGCEILFSERVHRIRKSEVQKYSVAMVIRSILVTIMAMGPIITAVITFAIYVLVYTNRQLSAVVVFPALAAFECMKLTWIIEMLPEAYRSVGKLESFLEEEELKDSHLPSMNVSEENIPSRDGSQTAIITNKCSWMWELEPELQKRRRRISRALERLRRLPARNKRRLRKRERQETEPLQNGSSSAGFPKYSNGTRMSQSATNTKNEFLQGITVTGPQLKFDSVEDLESEASAMSVDNDVDDNLHEISFQVTKGELVCIVGENGSGMSSLLSALIGDLTLTSGTIDIHGEMAYCSREAWIQSHKTIRDNILFYRPWNEERYHSVLLACNLEHDLAHLPGGDRHVVGRNGLALNQDQRNRIALARASYSDAHVILLNNPLAASDDNTRREVFDKCIDGILKNRTRLLATSDLEELKRAHNIIVMRDGTILQQATIQELARDKYGVMDALVDMDNTEALQLEESREIHSAPSPMIRPNDSWTMLAEYLFHYGGLPSAGTTLGLFTLSQICILISYVWIALWAHGTLEFIPAWVSLMMYALITVFATVATFQSNVFCFACGMSASRKIHDTLLNKILNASMQFYDTISGRDLHLRFGRDLECTDTQLTAALSGEFTSASRIVAIIVIIGINVYWFLLFLPLLAVMFAVLQHVYHKNYDQFSQMSSNSGARCLSHFEDSLTGTSAIRAFGTMPSLFEEHTVKIDDNQRALGMQMTATSWLSLRLGNLANLVVLIVGLMCVLPMRYTVYPPLFGVAGSGLALLCALQLGKPSCEFARHHAMTRYYMHATERLIRMSQNVELEQPKIVPLFPIRQSWPERGRIEFKDYSLHHGESYNLVLRNLNFKLGAGETITICGIPGSGQQYIAKALLHMVDPNHAKGKIKIDKVDTSRLGLHEVRRAISVLPQVPVLFSGTIRRNLDPLQRHDDRYLWECLRRAHVDNEVAKLEACLDHVVTADADELNFRTKTLLCLARVIVSQTKILILDNAGMVETDVGRMVNNIIHNDIQLMQCSKIAIAQPLSPSLFRCDRVMVIERGKLIEFDTPDKLLSNKASHFSKLLERTSPARAASIVRVVKESTETARKRRHQRTREWEEEQSQIRQSTLSPPDEMHVGERGTSLSES